MKFNRSQAVSFKAADDGDYVGVLIGFSYIGMHDTKDWGPKPKVMIRWELHDEEEHHPCLDEEGLIYVVSQSFPATVDGENSWLYKCLLAHGIMTPGSGCPDSQDWYGKVALLTIEGAKGSKGDRVFMNVTGIQPLDHDVNIKPVLSYEHWEPESSAPPPSWAKAMIERSRDIYQRAYLPSGASPAGGQKPRPGTPVGRPANPSSSYRPPAPAGGYHSLEGDDPDDIPF